MSTEQIVPQTPSALVTFQGLGGELAEVPFSIENIELIQNTSRAEGGIPGKFRVKSTGEHFDEIYGAPIGLQTKRVLFPGKNNFGVQPLCRSNDGIRPADNVIDRKADLCKACPFGQWKVVNGKRIRPQCDEKLEYLYFDRQRFRVFRINVGGSSISELKGAVKDIGNQVNAAKLKAQFLKRKGDTVEGMELGFDSFVLHMKPIKIVGNEGVYYVNRFSTGLANGDEIEQIAFRETYNDAVQKVMERFTRGAQEEQMAQAESATNNEFQQAQPEGAPEVTDEPVIEA